MYKFCFRFSNPSGNSNFYRNSTSVAITTDLPTTPKGPSVSKHYCNKQSSTSLQNKFLKKIKTMRSVAKSVERKFEEIESLITYLPGSNNGIGTKKLRSFTC